MLPETMMNEKIAAMLLDQQVRVILDVLNEDQPQGFALSGRAHGRGDIVSSFADHYPESPLGLSAPLRGNSV